MHSAGVSPQELNHAEREAQIEALKWIAAKGLDPIERIQAFRKVFELRARQREQGRAP